MKEDYVYEKEGNRRKKMAKKWRGGRKDMEKGGERKVSTSADSARKYFFLWRRSCSGSEFQRHRF